MAITNSEASRRPSWPRGYNKLGALAVIAQKGFRCLGLAGLFAVSWLGVSEDASNFARRAEKHYREAQRKFQTSTKDAEAAWQFSRACFDWAEFAIDAHQREAIAVEGIAACRHLLARDLKSAPGHFYLAMNLGQLARTRTLGALKIVDEMEREFKAARELDAKFDYAGADRC